MHLIRTVIALIALFGLLPAGSRRKMPKARKNIAKPLNRRS